MMAAPIVLFVFNRPDHTKKTLEALLKNLEVKDCDLIVYSDGARSDQDLQKIKETRALFDNLSGFKSVKLIKRDENWGLAKSIIFGVTKTLENYSQVIVMEDDLVVSPYFLKYMLEGLKTYQNDEKVASIHGYQLPLKNITPETYFLRGADCWGWATWRRAWKHFEPNGVKLLQELEARNLTKKFDLDGAVGHTQMLRDQIAGKINSWAIRWHASAYLQGMLTLYPGVSLVNNIGNDGSGEHCESSGLYVSHVAQNPINIQKIEPFENVDVRKNYINFYRKSGPSFIKRLIKYIPRKIKEYVLQFA